MPSNNNLPEEDLLPFGALTGSPVDSSVREQLGQATNGKQKVQRSPRALRPLWYSIPILVIALAIAGYLIGLTLWSRSSLKHWKAQDYEAAQAGYEGQRTWTGIGIEAWVAHYNLGTTLVRQDRVDEGVAELRTAFDLVPKATEVQPGRLEPFSYECRVRVNLGIGLEIQGDQLRAAGSTADAVSVYQEAEDTISPATRTNPADSPISSPAVNPITPPTKTRNASGTRSSRPRKSLRDRADRRTSSNSRASRASRRIRRPAPAPPRTPMRAKPRTKRNAGNSSKTRTKTDSRISVTHRTANATATRTARGEGREPVSLSL